MYAYAEAKQTEKAKASVRPSQMKTAAPNTTGIPSGMKAQYENLSGFSFDDVHVHYNSDRPAQLQAYAYTQGNQVYIAPGQEKHLAHELGHVVQQKAGEVRQTEVVNGFMVNSSPVLEAEADAIAQGRWKTDKQS